MIIKKNTDIHSKQKKKEEEIIWTYQVQACTKITVNSAWLF